MSSQSTSLATELNTNLSHEHRRIEHKDVSDTQVAAQPDIDRLAALGPWHQHSDGCWQPKRCVFELGLVKRVRMQSGTGELTSHKLSNCLQLPIRCHFADLYNIHIQKGMYRVANRHLCKWQYETTRHHCIKDAYLTWCHHGGVATLLLKAATQSAAVSGSICITSMAMVCAFLVQGQPHTT